MKVTVKVNSTPAAWLYCYYLLISSSFQSQNRFVDLRLSLVIINALISYFMNGVLGADNIKLLTAITMTIWLFIDCRFVDMKRTGSDLGLPVTSNVVMRNRSQSIRNSQSCHDDLSE